MAFTTIGSPDWGSSPTIDIDIAYDYQRSGADMQYKIRITVNTLRTSTAFFGYPIYASISLDGTSKVSGYTIKGASPSTWSSAIVYTTDWLTVANKTSGSTTLSVNIYSGLGSTRDYTYTYTLPVAPGASSVSASGGTLGTEQTLTVTRYNSSFTHTITYSCGDASGTICTKSSSTSVKWVPPISLAAQNTTGSSVSIKLTITTYDGSAQVGDSKTTTFTASIPSSVKPTASLALSDPTGYKSTYGGYIQGKSQLKVTLSGTGNQGSTIKSYQIKIGSDTYSGSSKTADLPNSGSLTVQGTVTDSRSRTSNPDSATIEVLAYTPPKITNLTVKRCTEDGTVKSDGAYAKVEFSAEITPLSAKNSAGYKIQYKQEGSASWSDIDLADLDGNYSPTGIAIVFPANIDYAYNVRGVCTDAFGSTVSSTRTVPVAFVLIQTDDTGTGIAFGQRATEAGVFRVAMPFKTREDIHSGKDIYMGGQNAQTEERHLWFSNPEDSEHHHRVHLYGGNPQSATSIGVWDALNGRSVFKYEAEENGGAGRVLLQGFELNLKVGVRTSTNLSELANKPSAAAAYGRYLQFIGSSDNYYILIDSSGRLFTGCSLYGESTITWYEK